MSWFFSHAPLCAEPFYFRNIFFFVLTDPLQIANQEIEQFLQAAAAQFSQGHVKNGDREKPRENL